MFSSYDPYAPVLQVTVLAGGCLDLRLLPNTRVMCCMWDTLQRIINTELSLDSLHCSFYQLFSNKDGESVAYVGLHIMTLKDI